ncbi:conjugal transfer protein TraS [uncultured Cedecea sp.]|uniref:conjugal transfer protein TraS n=1 Tax=uncultured Cedecea sp. TaxID=988762 RepID=UPI00262D4FDC|nr:conjugal transfer protein TraS [uncultured Cedecea sp.]
MISNHKILQEVEALKILFKKGGNEVPGMWRCFWPGLSVVAWMTSWPLVLYGYQMMQYELSNKASIGIAASVIIGFLAGVFIMLQVVNSRALYLSIPQSFRETSVLCRFVSTKFRRYLFTYLVSYAVIIVLCSWFVYGAIYSTIGLIISSFSFMIYLNVDLNRYQLTALTSLLVSIKSKETISVE